MLVAVEKERGRLEGSNNNDENMGQAGSHVASIEQEKQRLFQATERGCVCTCRLYMYRAMISGRSTNCGRHPPATHNLF